MDPKDLIIIITNFLQAREGAAKQASEVARGELRTMKAELTHAVHGKDRTTINEVMSRAVPLAVSAGVWKTV